MSEAQIVDPEPTTRGIFGPVAQVPARIAPGGVRLYSPTTSEIGDAESPAAAVVTAPSLLDEGEVGYIAGVLRLASSARRGEIFEDPPQVSGAYG